MSAARAEVHIAGIQMNPKSKVSIELFGYFENLPPAGYVPVRVVIDNQSNAARSWRFRFQSDSDYQLRQQSVFVWEVSVEANRKAEFELVVPVSPVSSGRHAYPSLFVTVTGYGVVNPRGYYAANHTYSGHTHTAFTGMSKALAVYSEGPLKEEAERQSLELRSCTLDPEWLSPDWRSYIGFSTLWFSEGDWAQLSAAKRAGIMQWVSQGGTLLYVTEQPSARTLERAGLPGDGDDTVYGLGRVRVFGWDGHELALSSVLKAIEDGRKLAHADQVTSAYISRWGLSKQVPKAEINAPVMILAILAFAVLVGPVNLLMLAGKKRRHRLFVTTPIISLGASVGMIVLILLQDGMGGEGSRVALIHLMPEARQELIIQEQLSRTGVLLKSAFSAPADAHVALLQQRGDKNRARRRLTREASICSGDWFENRAVQGHYLSQIRPSRARVELLPEDAGAPVLLSTVEGDLEDVFYIDANGKYWRGDRLRVGEKLTLRASRRSEFRNDWWIPNVSGTGVRAGGHIDALKDRRGYFFARFSEPGDRLLGTLATVDWEHETVLVAGPCVPAGGGGS